MKFLFAIAVLLASPAVAQDGLSLVSPMIREAASAGSNTAGYLTIDNSGAADRLVAARSEIAERIEVHETTMSDGVMQMRPVVGGLDVGAGESVVLAPRGLHLMIMETTGPLIAGAVVDVVLVFETAGEVHVEFTVAPLGDILKLR